MRRVVVNRPEDPIKFLIKSISENPFKVADPATAVAATAESNAAGQIDNNS